MFVTSMHYPLPIHHTCGYEFLGYAAGALPPTEELAGEILSLPTYPEFATDAVDHA